MSGKMPTFGLIILSHANPSQVLRLIDTLNIMYKNPPIVWHHDFSQSEFDTATVPKNVKLLLPSIKTGWGKWSVVQSLLRCLDLLEKLANPDWFTLLSGSDYPAASAETVLGELKNAKCDAFLDTHHLDASPTSARIIGDYNLALTHLETAEQYLCKERFYLKAQIWYPVIKRNPKLRIGRTTRYMSFRGFNPYSEEFGLFWGDHWFTGNRKCMRALLAKNSMSLKLQKYLKWRVFPEESYYQTILCNTPELQISRDNKRFAIWNGGGAHPMTLRESDVSEILSSGAHFARKFQANSPALDMLDEILRK